MSERPAGRESEPGPSGRGSGQARRRSPSGPAGGQERAATREHLDFPDGFVWGTATAAHQIEGGNWNNDWWAWEHDPASGCAEGSGDACDSWNRWEEDVALVGDLGLGTYRLSVEWSRVEPEDGDSAYEALRKALQSTSVEP